MDPETEPYRSAQDLSGREIMKDEFSGVAVGFFFVISFALAHGPAAAPLVLENVRQETKRARGERTP